MEPQISDTKAKPMRYAGLLSFLEKFILVPNQSIQVWRLKFLIPTAFLIMAVAVRIQCDPDDLCKAKRIKSLLDSCTEDYCKIEIPGVNYSGFNNHQISLPEHNTQYTQLVFSVVEQKFDTFIGDVVISSILGPNQSRTPISMAGMEFQSAIYEDESAQVPISHQGGRLDERGSTRAQVRISRNGRRLDQRESTPAQLTISRHRGRLDERESTPSQDTISRHGMRLDERESIPAQLTISRHRRRLDKRESTPSQVTISHHGMQRESTPAQVSLLNILLGPNQSDPVWWLRLLAALSLVIHATMGVLILPGDLQGVHATYQRLMLITSFGVPIFVAVITLLVSIWLVPDPSGRSNWITGLSVANFSLLGGRLAVYWTIKRGTENILRGEAIELMREVI